MFNALKYTQALEKAGFTKTQAETSMNLLIEVMNENFATKADLEKAVANLATKVELRGLESKIHSLELKTEIGFRDLENKLTLRMGAMFMATITIQTVVLTLIMKSFFH